MVFQRAVKRESKLRLALAGPAGSGKTYTALTLATALADGRPVAVVDTERGSASKYADIFEFDVLELDSFHPDRYIEAIHDAVAAGYSVVVIDSLSHAWNATDGLLELVERIAKRDRKNTFQAWGDVKPIENRLVEAITGSNIHVIATMRTKSEYVVEEVERNGRKVSAPRKIGTAPIQRDGFEYEFDVFGELTLDNDLIVQKTRCPALTGQVIAKPGKPMADVLKTWLAGAASEPVTTPHIVPSSYGANHTDGRKAAPQETSQPSATMAGLRLRLRFIGARSVADADRMCKEAIGKTWEQATEDDSTDLEKWIVAKEAEKARKQDEAAAARVPDHALMPHDEPGEDTVDESA